MEESTGAVRLPAYPGQGGMPLALALFTRRSARRFVPGAISLEDLAALCFAAQGLTHPRGYRTAASAGALYPLELVVLAGEVDGVETGLYRYAPHSHVLTLAAPDDLRADLARACVKQSWMAQAPAVLVFCAVYRRVTDKYGQRGERYVHMEAGIASQNVALQAVALGLASTVVGAFDDARVRELVHAGHDEDPLIVMPVGRLPPTPG